MKDSRTNTTRDERRSRVRFPLVRTVGYRSLKKREGCAGQGETLNISSSGALFTTEQELPLGSRIKLVISWPMQLNDNLGLKLVADAVVVRADEGKAAVRFQSHELCIAAYQRGGAASAA
jgi:hypothetical protein